MQKFNAKRTCAKKRHRCVLRFLPFHRILPFPVKMHKSRAGSLAGERKKNSSNLFEKCFECGIIFVKYATKTERTLRAAEMREKPI